MKKKSTNFVTLWRYFVPLLAISLELLPTHLVNLIRRRTVWINSKPSIRFKQSIDTPGHEHSTYILMDSFPIPHWAVINTLAANILSNESEGKVSTFGFSRQSIYERKLYESLGVRNHLRIKLGFFSFFKALKIFFRISSLIRAGHKVIDLEINKMNVGLDVYESYLRRGHPTLDLDSRDLYRELWRGIKQIVYFQPLFLSKQVSAVFLSHDNYVGPGLLARIAYQYKTPVILINPFEVNIVQKPFQNYERFYKYRKYFQAQSDDWKLHYLEKARNQLDRRISGEIGVGNMKYQVKSAFTNHCIGPQIRNSTNKKLLILCHDFFDNPHGYARMLFDDFIDWLVFVTQCCFENNIDCYIKLHRDFSDIEYTVIRDFQRNYPWVSMVDSEVSYHQLYKEGIRFVTTCYGSAGHELPLIGFTVINSSHNPHIAYSFNYHAKSKSEYRDYLVEQKPILIDDKLKREIYEFYSVHTFLMSPDSFNMESFEGFSQFCQNDFTGSLALKYLDDNFSEIKRRVYGNFMEALNSSRVFSVDKSLSQVDQDFFEDRLGSQVSQKFV